MALYDYETALALAKTGRHVHALFLCHQAVERMLKAMIARNMGQAVPRSSNLRLLVRKLDIRLEGHQEALIENLSPYSLCCLYPHDLTEGSEEISRDQISLCLERTCAFLRQPPVTR